MVNGFRPTPTTANGMGPKNRNHIKHDTGRTQQVLLSRRFKYFGSNGPDLPNLRDLTITEPIRNKRRHFSERDYRALMEWLGSLKGKGPLYEPSDWAETTRA